MYHLTMSPIFSSIISSKDNQYVHLVRGLARKKQRDAAGLFLAEGLTNIREALNSCFEPELLLASADLAAEAGRDGRAGELIALAEGRGAKVLAVEPRLMAGLSQTEASQGMILVLRKPKLEPADFVQAAKGRPIAVLDGLQDPGNVGTILRTAWAAGLGGVLLINDSADIYAPKVVRAAMGATYHLPHLALRSDEAWQLVQELGCELVCADAGGEDFRTRRCAQGRPPAWLLGREATGPSELWRSRAVWRVAIPMQAGVDSLNVAVAAGILFFSAASADCIEL